MIRKTLRLACIALALMSATSASAQFRVGPVLAAGPIQLKSGTDLTVSQIGQKTAVLQATAFAAVGNVQRLLMAMLPQLNQRIGCGPGKKVGGTVNSIRLSTQGDILAITVAAHGQLCGPFAIGDDMVIVVPIAVVVQSNKVVLVARNASVTAAGFFGTTVRVTPAQKVLTAHVAQAANKFNAWVNKQLAGPAVKKWIDAYNLKIQTAGVSLQSGDLTVTLNASGQTPISSLDAQLGR
jgi:hypothetical protein